MRSSGWDYRLFSNHTFTIDMIHQAAPIGNPPMARHELDSFIRAVFDPDVIDPEPSTCRHMRLFGQKIHSDPNGDSVCHCCMLK